MPPPKPSETAAAEINKVLLVNEKKWTKPLMAGGWTAFPSVILENQAALKLSAVDVNILLYLSTHWWTADNKPRPSKTTIGKAIGLNARSVQRHISAMESKGLIRREERRLSGVGSKPNHYHFDGLIKAATPYAESKAEEIKEKIAKKARKASTGKPGLRLVKK